VAGHQLDELRQRAGVAPGREVRLFVGEPGLTNVLEALGFDRGDRRLQLVVALLLLGVRGRGRGQRFGRRSVVDLSLLPGLFELVELVAGLFEPASELVGVAQLGRDPAPALVEHGGGGGLSGRGGREVAADGSGRPVGGVARLVAGLAQLGRLRPLGENGGLAGELALGSRRRGVLGRSADRARGSGFERGGKNGGLPPRPGRLEVGQLGGGALRGELGDAENAVARLGGALVGLPGGRQSRRGRVEIGLRPAELADPGDRLGKRAHQFAQRQPLRAASRL
jgi:hypothetical protein